LFMAERGAGSFCDEQRLRVSEVQQVSQARVDFDFSGLNDRTVFLERALRIVHEAGQLRCYGSAVASLCHVATADSEAYVHMNLAPWDFAAAQLIVEEAGGKSSRLDGSPLRLFDKRNGILISNGPVHQELLRLLNR
jgi:myo-inositol-1(or 4)-monophosphatase